jgi:hypothetical protein
VKLPKQALHRRSGGVECVLGARLGKFRKSPAQLIW